MRSYSGRSPRNFVIIHTMLECMLAILKGPESIGRYEGMDLDLKGGRTRWQGRLRGLEVGRAISEPSVAQWLTGAIQPTSSCLYLSPFLASASFPPTISSAYALLSCRSTGSCYP